MKSPTILDIQNLKQYAEENNFPLPPQWYIDASLKRDRITAVTTLGIGVIMGIIIEIGAIKIT